MIRYPLYSEDKLSLPWEVPRTISAYMENNKCSKTAVQVKKFNSCFLVLFTHARVLQMLILSEQSTFSAFTNYFVLNDYFSGYG